MMTNTVRLALTILRIGTALIFVIHGVARASLGIVDDFGVALNSWGFPVGLVLAWTITVVEIAGGAALALGYFVRPLTLWFAVQLAMGVYLFTRGPGGSSSARDATTWSLVVIAMTGPAGYVVGRRSGR